MDGLGSTLNGGADWCPILAAADGVEDTETVRRIKREALEEGIKVIQSQRGGENYLKALKKAVRLLREVKAKL